MWFLLRVALEAMMMEALYFMYKWWKFKPCLKFSNHISEIVRKAINQSTIWMLVKKLFEKKIRFKKRAFEKQFLKHVNEVWIVSQSYCWNTLLKKELGIYTPKSVSKWNQIKSLWMTILLKCIILATQFGLFMHSE